MLFQHQSSPRWLLALLLASTLCLSACNGNGLLGANPNAKVMTVDGVVVTRAEYDKVHGQVEKALKVDLSQVSDPAQKQMLEQTLQQMTLQKLVMDTMLKNDAEKLGVTVSDADVKQFKEEKLSQDPQAKAQLKQYLEENLMSEKDFDESLKQTLLVDRFIEKTAGAKAKVNDQEVNQFYKSHPEQFKVPEQIRAHHILVKFIPAQLANDLKAASPNKPDADIQAEVSKKQAEAKNKAQDLYNKLKQDPKQFDALAKASSDDPGSAQQGGDLNYVIERNIDPVFWRALKSTKPGQLHNGVVETQFGYHVIKVDDLKAPKTMTLAEAKPMVAQYLESEKKQKLLMEWATKKRDTAKVDIEKEYQPKLDTPAAGGVQPPQPAADGSVTLGKRDGK